jgi:hypothetical protein
MAFDLIGVYQRPSAVPELSLSVALLNSFLELPLPV